MPSLFLGGLQEFADIKTHDRGGNHSEVGKRGVAAANAGHAKENIAERVALCDLLHFRTRIGDGDKAIADFLFTDFLFDSVEKILLIDIGLERAAGLAGHDAQGALEIDLGLDSFDLRGIGGIKNMQLWKP